MDAACKAAVYQTGMKPFANPKAQVGPHPRSSWRSSSRASNPGHHPQQSVREHQRVDGREARNVHPQLLAGGFDRLPSRRTSREATVGPPPTSAGRREPFFWRTTSAGSRTARKPSRVRRSFWRTRKDARFDQWSAKTTDACRLSAPTPRGRTTRRAPTSCSCVPRDAARTSNARR